MKKHFLVTISNDIENLFGVRFLCSFFHSIGEHQVTLLHICRSDDSAMAKTLNQMWQGPSEGIEGQVTVSARRAIFKARELLAEHNLATEHMVTKTFSERYGKVKDILEEGGARPLRRHHSRSTCLLFTAMAVRASRRRNRPGDHQR